MTTREGAIHGCKWNNHSLRTIHKMYYILTLELVAVLELRLPAPLGHALAELLEHVGVSDDDAARVAPDADAANAANLVLGMELRLIRANSMSNI